MQMKVFTYLKSVLGLLMIGAMYLIYNSVTVQNLFSETLKNHISNNIYQKKKFVFVCNKDYFNNNYVKEFCGQTVVCHQQKQNNFIENKLLQVQAVIRHGDRTPLKYDLYKTFFTDVNFCTENIGMLSGKFSKKVIHEVKRQLNERGFLKFYSKKFCSPGQLTLYGMAQQVSSGLVLRKKYENQRLLHETENVLFYSTKNSRTLQSGAAFLKALIPRANLQVRFSDSTKFCGDKCTCENADKSFRSKQANLIHQPISNDEVVKNLSKAFNLTLHPRRLIDGLINGFSCKYLPLPLLEDSRSYKQLEHVLNLYHKIQKKADNDLLISNASMLTMQPLISQLASNMNTEISSPEFQKFVLYSGHDETIESLIRLLHLPYYVWPPVASRLVFELWQAEDIGKHVRIYFNGKDVTSESLVCKGLKVCTLHHFKNFFEIDIFRYFGANSREEACNAQH